MSYANIYTLNVDLKQAMTSIVPSYKQGETAFLRFRLFDNGHHLDTTPYTYSEIVHKLPSGNKIMGNLDLITVDGEQLLEYRYTGVELAELGKVEVQLVIQSADTNVAIRPFKIVIYDDMRDDDLTYIGILQELIAEVSLLKEEMYKAINSWVFRNSYSASVQYYRHNVVEYQGSSWIALRDTKGNSPPTLPTISNLNWYLIARKADGGISQGEFITHTSDFNPHGTSSNYTLHVDWQLGNDSSGNGDYDSPFKTITRALSTLPRYIYHEITIECKAGVYDESVKVHGFLGINYIFIKSSSDTDKVILKDIDIRDCVTYVNLTGIHVTTSSKSAIIASDCNFIVIDECIVDGFTHDYYGILAERNATIHISNSIISNKEHAIASEYLSRVTSSNNAGVNNLIGLKANGGGFIGKILNQPSAEELEFADLGGFII